MRGGEQVYVYGALFGMGFVYSKRIGFLWLWGMDAW